MYAKNVHMPVTVMICLLEYHISLPMLWNC